MAVAGSDTLHGQEGDDILRGDYARFTSVDQPRRRLDLRWRRRRHPPRQCAGEATRVPNLYTNFGAPGDSLLGDDGDDILYGYDGNDGLDGGAGNDRLVGAERE